jgi:outer membrane protein OmpA-like peptidoglycan-associated protein
MASLRSLLIAGAAVAILHPAAVEAGPSLAGVLMVAETRPATVAAAEKAVSEARAQLRRAMASGKGLKDARAALAAAQKLLDEAKVAAAKPPAAVAMPNEAAGKPRGYSASAASGGSDTPGGPRPPVVELAPGEEPPPPAVEDAPALPPPAIVRAGPGVGAVAVDGAPAVAPAGPAAQSIGPVGIGEKAADGRVVVRENGQLVVTHDEEARFRMSGGRVFDQQAGDGQRITTVNRPDGSQIVTVGDADGNIVRRTRKRASGEVVVLVEAKPADKQQIAAGLDYLRRLPPIVLDIPMQQYVVEGRQAAPQVIEETLAAPPVEQVERPYALAEIRTSVRLRDKLRRVDVDTIDFDQGQATLAEDQVAQLDSVGHALADIIGTRPDEVFLIEGHTDAVGSDLANLMLSDRRAEAVAEILTYSYKVPPENMVTQGYGAQYLKVPTEAPERENRRLTIRRITPLLRGTDSE